MFKRIMSKFTKEDFLPINEFVRLQYERSAKYEHMILKMITGMEIYMFVFGLFKFNLANPRASIYLTLYALLAIVSFITDTMITIAEKKHNFRTSKALSFVGYFYFAFIVAWGLVITTLDIMHGGSYWVSATIMMAISVFLNLNPIYTISIILAAGVYLCGLNTYVEGGFSDRMMNIVIFILVDCAIILNNYFIQYNNAYMEHKLDNMSKRDGLTGVNNRLALESLKETDLHIVSVAIIDIDNFKMINDIGGHSQGDEALLRLTSLFREYFMDKEIYRYGGDEFVILSEREVDSTKNRLESINERLKVVSSQTKFTISGGVVAYDQSLSIAKCLQEADEHLYEVKKSGKGKISVEY